MSILSSVGGLLLGKGMDTLSELIVDVSSKGLDLIQNTIEGKTGLKFTSSSLKELTDDDISNINQVVVDNKLELERLALENNQIILENTKDARAMQVEATKNYHALTKEGKSTIGTALAANFIYITAGGVIFLIIAYIFTVTFLSDMIPEANLRFVDQSLGNFFGILSTIIGFFFGGVVQSRSERDK